MLQDTVVYTDGHGVTVTNHRYVVKDTEYLLEGITNVRMYFIKARKIIPVLLVILGLGVMISGAIAMYSKVNIESIYIGSLILDSNALAVNAGAIMLLVGIIWLSLIHKKYAVLITTAEGEKCTIISPKKDYIGQIVSALKKAINLSTN